MSSFVEQIKQVKPFSSEKEEVTLLLIRVCSNHSANLNAVYSNHNLNLSTYNILRILRGQKAEGLPVTEIARRMVVRSPDITRCIDKLVKLGYVEKKKIGLDKRITCTKITEDGLRLLEALDEPVISTIQSFMNCLDDHEVSQLNEITNKLMSHYDSNHVSKKDHSINNLIDE